MRNFFQWNVKIRWNSEKLCVTHKIRALNQSKTLYEMFEKTFRITEKLTLDFRYFRRCEQYWCFKQIVFFPFSGNQIEFFWSKNREKNSMTTVQPSVKFDLICRSDATFKDGSGNFYSFWNWNNKLYKRIEFDLNSIRFLKGEESNPR